MVSRFPVLVPSEETVTVAVPAPRLTVLLSPPPVVTVVAALIESMLAVSLFVLALRSMAILLNDRMFALTVTVPVPLPVQPEEVGAVIVAPVSWNVYTWVAVAYDTV